MKALFWRRVWALLIDLVAAGFALVAVFAAGSRFTELNTDDANLVITLFFVLYGAAFLSKDGFRGQSLGKKFMRLRVVSAGTCEPVGFLRSWLRNFLFAVYTLAAVIAGALVVNTLCFVFDNFFVKFGASSIMFDILMTIVLVRVWAFELFNAKNNPDGLKLSDRHSGTKVISCFIAS